MNRIFCFSGTGNSMYVARLLAGALGDTEIDVLAGECLLEPSAFEAGAGVAVERVVWVFPTYSWGVPPVVARFIERASLGDGIRQARHYMVTTCGDDMGRADRQWRRLLAGRGIDGLGAFSVQMPNTYVCMKGFDVDSEEVAAAKIEAAPARVRAIADAIVGGGADMLERGAFAGIKSGLIYPWFVRYAMSPKPFRVSDCCTGCGRCSRSCPMGNIHMDAGRRPQWGGQCALCLRCYHICPSGAVAYGGKTRGKSRYTMMMRLCRN